ncbi:MAG: YibE/F family protein, partial [Desertimonas sp.]
MSQNGGAPSHSHSHHHARGELDGVVSSSAARTLRIACIACAVLLVIGVAVLWPGSRSTGADPLGLAADPIDAHVLHVEELPCEANPDETCANVFFELTGGDRDGELASMENGTVSTIDAGDDIQLVEVDVGDGTVVYSFYDYQRSTTMLVLVALFALAVLGLGRWRGLGALAGLLASFGVIIWFALPSIIDGNNAVAVALVTSGVVAMLALYLAHGTGPS